MLFSSAELAQFINAAFEPAWESVRPVPIVTIDFGNGTRITRTLHGNIATSVCDADGKVLDILPGIYTPDEYRKQLDQFRLLHVYATRSFPQRPEAALRDYHTRQAERLKADRPADVLVMNIRRDAGKARIENPVKLLAADGATAPKSQPTAPPSKASPPAASPAAVAGWKELAEDTRINESVRRRQIHEKLAATGPVPPEKVLKWLYKDVLHADLDDPMLGLGEVLNKNYPFADEDRRRAIP